MNKLYNNRFIFIVGLSLAFIMVLTFGSIMLTKKNQTEFNDAGYIISSNKVLSFDSGTTYRYNLDEKIVFSTNDGNIYAVDPASFIHYEDKSIALLKNGAFVDVNALSESIVPYYNITNKSLIRYKDGGYGVKNGNEELYFDDILLRVNDDKFLIAGRNLSVRIPGLENLLTGDYFEVTFIENGIVLIENDKDSYQVTADGTSIYVSDKVTIDLGTKNILSSGEVKLNMSEVTIDGNENITIVPEEKEEDKNNQSDDNTSEVEPTNPSVEPENPNDNQNEPSKPGETEEPSDPNEEPETPAVPVDTEVSVELVKLKVDVTRVTATLQVNNPLMIKGKLVTQVIDVNTNEVMGEDSELSGITIDTGVKTISVADLKPNSNYVLTVKEIKDSGETVEYLQRVFTTSNYGVSLQKVMITDNEAIYSVLFSMDSPVKKVKFALYDGDGKRVDEKTEEVVNEEGATLSYINLSSNSTYTIKAIEYTTESSSVSDIENGLLKRSFKTLKQKPDFDGMVLKVEANPDNLEFTLRIVGLESEKDPDGAITKYTYKIYEDTGVGEPVLVKDSSQLLTVSVGEENADLLSNKNYRYRVLIEYYDNEKTREFESGFSDQFVLTGAKVTFEQSAELTSINTIGGTLTLYDPDCTVPMPGRTGCNAENSFSIAYYVNDTRRYKPITFEASEVDNTFVVRDVTISGLKAKTQYSMELIGDKIVKDEDPNTTTTTKIVTQAVIGNPFTAQTSEKSTLKIVKKDENTLSNKREYPFDAVVSLESNSSNENYINEVQTLSVNLYALDASNNRIKVGNTVVLNNSDIKSLLYNKDYTMTNKFFGIDSLSDLAAAATDANGWIYVNYVITFTDAYDTVLAEVSEASNQFEIEDNEVTASISRAFLLNYYAEEREASTLLVTEIKNRERSTPIAELDGSITVGYRLNATIDLERILLQYYGVTGADNLINWDYVYYILDKEGNIIYTSEKTKSTAHTFYLDDEIEGYHRGGVYSFAFQIVVSDGIYPSEAVIGSDKSNKTVFNPLKQSPIIEMAMWESSATTLTYMYRVASDIDGALYGNNLYIYTSSNMLVDTESIDNSGEIGYVTFQNLSNSTTYNIRYNKINEATENGYELASKGNFYFDGYHDLSSTFKLSYEDRGNRLGIIIEDEEFLNRSDVFEVMLKSNNEEQKLLFLASDVVDCGDEKKNCLIVSYESIENFQGSNVNVSVSGYYENGLIGINQTGEYHVFKDDANDKYLTFDNLGNARTNMQYSGGLYKYLNNGLNITLRNLINGHAWDDNMRTYEYSLIMNSGTGGANFGRMGVYNPKVVSKRDLTSTDSIFKFSNIIPMARTTTASTINSVSLNVNLSGITKRIVNNEFQNGDKKIYVELYDADDLNSVLDTKAVDINEDNVSDIMSYTFTGLIPAHKYAYKIFANILNSEGIYQKEELYDYRADGKLEIKNKEVSTLDASGIFTSFDAMYSSEYLTTASSGVLRTIETDIKLKNIQNYALELRVVDADSNAIFSEDIDTASLGTSIIRFFRVTDDSYTFGDAGYKVTLTAVTEEGSRLELYSNDFKPHLKGNANVYELREVAFDVSNLSTYVVNGETKYTMSFQPVVNDADLVLNSSQYKVRVFKREGTNEIALTPTGRVLDDGGYITLNNSLEIGPSLTYKNLEPDTIYFIEIKGTTTRNNASLADKVNEVSWFAYPRTGNNYNLSLGSGTLNVENKKITIDYRGANNLDNLTKVEMTIYKEGAAPYYIDYTRSTNLASHLKYNTLTSAWSFEIDLTNSSVSYSSNDRIMIEVAYYAENLEGVESLVSQVTYANY